MCLFIIPNRPTEKPFEIQSEHSLWVSRPCNYRTVRTVLISFFLLDHQENKYAFPQLTLVGRAERTILRSLPGQCPRRVRYRIFWSRSTKVHCLNNFGEHGVAKTTTAHPPRALGIFLDWLAKTLGEYHWDEKGGSWGITQTCHRVSLILLMAGRESRWSLEEGGTWYRIWGSAHRNSCIRKKSLVGGWPFGTLVLRIAHHRQRQHMVCNSFCHRLSFPWAFPSPPIKSDPSI